MSADLVQFIIRFDEHEPTGRWVERKYEIADFIAKCWYHKISEQIGRLVGKTRENKVKSKRDLTFTVN